MDEFERRTKRCLFLMQADITQGITHNLAYYMTVLEGRDRKDEA